MNAHLAAIRREMAVKYAIEHPEVRLVDIGIALGYTDASAKSAVSGFITDAGIDRPRGKAAQSFPAEAHFRSSVLDPHKTEIKRMVEQDFSFQTIGDKFGVDYTSVGNFVRNRLGVHRGQGRRSGVYYRVSDQKILATIKAHPDWSVRKIGIELGYAPKSGGFNRRVRALKRTL